MEENLDFIRRQIIECVEYVSDAGMLDLVYKLLASAATPENQYA